ncbi:hypothetical protein SCD_n01055 [Sulfuricella denitrificans skB26]|uniref:Ice-binding protein C-terminal domain-containing protein n=1 Tax=Sulfuricella denitrificans (strain DSM 22764 / NBRC 105220 / skB26) TaxID=1163617 RepID=S6ABP5_SULDS|nr:VPLPA-CTERM sorting domain-containing protein [Sulfuricella denitrificans]BAN34893.1 hypothetical protein SCD_n01055 [Sulfuricella denitrificans skB26]
MKSKILFILSLTVLLSGTANAATTSFFTGSEVATLVASGATSDTISSNGYLFTYTRDKLFTGGVSTAEPGRYVRVPWPDGVEAQAVTVGPVSKPQITISRVDGNVFDITAFTAKLLASSGGAGGAFEVVPLINGEDKYKDPVAFNATGYTNQIFSYGSPSTSLLTGADAYKFSLYVDFALTGLTLVDASTTPVPVPAALWLFGTGLIGLAGVIRKRKTT